MSFLTAQTTDIIHHLTSPQTPTAPEFPYRIRTLRLTPNRDINRTIHPKSISASNLFIVDKSNLIQPHPRTNKHALPSMAKWVVHRYRSKKKSLPNIQKKTAIDQVLTPSLDIICGGRIRQCRRLSLETACWIKTGFFILFENSLAFLCGWFFWAPTPLFRVY